MLEQLSIKTNHHWRHELQNFYHMFIYFLTATGHRNEIGFVYPNQQKNFHQKVDAEAVESNLSDLFNYKQAFILITSASTKILKNIDIFQEFSICSIENLPLSVFSRMEIFHISSSIK